MQRFARRSFASLCAALLLFQTTASCYRRQSRVPERVSRDVAAGRQLRIVGATLRDGTDLRFDERAGAVVRNDSLIAVAAGAPVAVPMSDVQRVWVRAIDPGLTAVAVIGTVAVVAAVTLAAVLATKESCPFVYSWDGTQYVFDAEPYGGAVSRGLERDDYGRLDHLRADSAGLYRLMVTNEVNETQHTNSMRLFVVDHAPGVRVEPDEYGRLHAMSSVLPPSAAHDETGRDLVPWLRATDRAAWEPAPAADPQGGVRGEIVVTFPKPPGAARADLVVNASTGMWGSHMIREMLRLRGSAVRDWYAALDSSPGALDSLRRWNVREELYVLQLQIEERDGWHTRALLPGGGPFIAEDRVVPLDVSRVEGDSLRVRVRPPAGYWAFNSFGVSYGESTAAAGRAFAVDTVMPLAAETSDGRDVIGDLRAADDRYYSMPTNDDRAFVTFRAPAARPGMERTVFLHSRGWYRLHLPEEGPPDVVALRRITEQPDGAARLAAELFARRGVAAIAP